MKALLALLLAFSAARPGELRLAYNSRLSGWMRETAPDSIHAAKLAAKRQALDYFRKLGFTHIVYYLEDPYSPAFQKVNGEWIYNGGDYRSGDHSLSLAQIKKEVESRGMSLVPVVPSLSHVQGWTALDPSISEFDQLHPKPPPPWDWPPAWKASYEKYDGVAAAGPLGYNPGADQIFRECLRIIKAVWSATGGPQAHPGQILIGHDELGYNQICFVKAGKGKNLPETAAELVAMEIDARHRQIQSEVDSAMEVFLYGDSFVPGDYGATYGLVGDSLGRGGVLRLLQEKYGMAGKVTVLPWIYSSLEADGADPYRKLIISKRRQLAYLERLGVSFIAATGEDGIVPYDQPVERTLQSLYEWVRESRLHRGARGYAHFSYSNFDECRPAREGFPRLCSGFSAPVLAWLAWTQGGWGAEEERGFSPRVLSRVEYLKSRGDRDWRAGAHFPRR